MDTFVNSYIRLLLLDMESAQVIPINKKGVIENFKRNKVRLDEILAEIHSLHSELDGVTLDTFDNYTESLMSLELRIRYVQEHLYENIYDDSLYHLITAQHGKQIEKEILTQKKEQNALYQIGSQTDLPSRQANVMNLIRFCSLEKI